MKTETPAELKREVKSDPKPFEVTTQEKMGFTVRRIRQNYVEILKGDDVVGKIAGDITDAVVEDLIIRIKVKQQKEA